MTICLIKVIQFWPLTVQLYQTWLSVSFERFAISFSKSVSSTCSIEQMKKLSKFGALLQLPRFTI